VAEAPAAPRHLPVVIIGADCQTLGAVGVSATGDPAYCAQLASVQTTVWALYAGQVDVPTATPGPGETVYPVEIEQQIRLCVQETGRSRVECRDDIRRGNITGPA
jgi:serine/threonine-protein kinase